MNNILNLFYNNSLNTVIIVLAVATLLVGALECFAGYKIMRVMIAIYGFFIGACVGAVIGLCVDELWLSAVAGLLLGAAFAFIAYKLYLVGVFLCVGFNVVAVVLMIFGSALTAPHIIFATIIGVLAGVAAICFVRPVMIVSTAITGSAAVLSATCQLMSLTPFDHALTSLALFLGFSCGGIICQYKTSAKHSLNMISLVKKKQNKKRNIVPFSERKYPGMQRAYRNFCIKCGCELMWNIDRCPNCGFKYYN